MSSVLSGCLVTDSIEFEPPVNNPPMFVKRPGSDLEPGDIKFVKRSGAPSWPFSLRIRDADVDQDLEIRWRMIKGDDDSRRREAAIPLPAMGTATRDFDIVVQSGDLLTDNCHRIDIAVSSSFAGDPDDLEVFDVVTETDDLASFTFWIWEGETDSNDPQKLVETCRAEAVEPPMVTTGVAGESGQ